MTVVGIEYGRLVDELRVVLDEGLGFRMKPRSRQDAQARNRLAIFGV